MKNYSLLFSFAFILVLTSCSKKPNAEVDNETQSVFDFSNASREMLAMVPAIHQALINTPGTGANQSQTTAITCQSLVKTGGDTLWGTGGHVNPTYSIDVSSSVCSSIMPDKRKRDLKVFLTLTGKLQSPGTLVIAKIKGNWYATNESSELLNPYDLCDSLVLKTVSSDANALSFDVNLINGKIIQNNTGKTVQLICNLRLNSYLGQVVPYFTMFGAVNGVNANGLPFTASIAQSTAIKKFNNCAHFSSGKAEITPQGFKSRVVDYGTDTCDDDANFEVNGNTIAFKLK